MVAKVVRSAAREAVGILAALGLVWLWWPPVATATWTSSHLAQDGGTLTVRVVVVALGGAAPAAGVVKPPPLVDPIPNAVVRVRLPDGSGALEQLTDDQGQTTFTLAAGEYLVYLPPDQPQLGDTIYFFHHALPDGTGVLDWADVEVVAAGTGDVTLTATLNAP